MSRYITGLNQTSEEKSYCRLNLRRGSAFKSERLDILQDSIKHPSKKLLSFEFAHSELRSSISSISIYYRTPSDTRVKKLLPFEFAQTFNIQFQAFRYFTGLNRIAEQKVIVVWICSELRYSISSVSIYYGTESDIRVKSYCRLNLLKASTFKFERLDILRDSIRHPGKNLLVIEFAHNFGIQFRMSRHITGLNHTSE